MLTSSTSGSTPARRLVVLSSLSAGLGCVGGLVGFAFLRVTALLLNLALQHQVGWEFPSLSHIQAGWWLVPEAIAAGAVVAVLANYEPLIRGHGIPEAMEAVLADQSRISLRTAVVKPASSIIAIGTGAPFGAEGPIILTGGALGSLLGQAVRVSPSERRTLLAAGAAAGMSAIFGAPIGAVLLAIELLLFEFSPRILVPIVVASVFAGAVHLALLGQGPLFTAPVEDFAGLVQLPFFVVLGVVCGVVATVVTWGAFTMEDLFARLPIRRFWHPIIGAAAVAVLGVQLPQILGVGYGVIGESLAGRLSVGLLVAVFLGKLVAWCVAIGSGTSGSSLAPLLLIGSSLGALVGTGLHNLLPGAPVSPQSFAIVAMAAVFGAAAGAPFTAMVLVFEVTRDFEIVLPLMLATVVAHLLARAIQPQTLMTMKLARHRVAVSQRYQLDLQRITKVEAVMTSPVEAVDADMTVDELRERFRATDRHAFAVTSAGQAVGVITQGDIVRRGGAGAGTAVGDLATRDVVTVSPETTVHDASQRLLHEDIRQLLVVDGDDEPVGLFGRLDALRVTELELEREEGQPGWLTGGRTPGPTSSPTRDPAQDPAQDDE